MTRINPSTDTFVLRHAPGMGMSMLSKSVIGALSAPPGPPPR